MAPVHHQTFHICYLANPLLNVLASSPGTVIKPLLTVAQSLSSLIFVVPVRVGRSGSRGLTGHGADVYPVCFATAMVWLGVVMWAAPLLCSMSLCQTPSPSHDGNCQGPVRHICWMMATTIDWAQHAVVECRCVCVCVFVPADFCLLNLPALMNYACTNENRCVTACFSKSVAFCPCSSSNRCFVGDRNISHRHFLWLLWHSWWGRRETRGNCTN